MKKLAVVLAVAAFLALAVLPERSPLVASVEAQSASEYGWNQYEVNVNSGVCADGSVGCGDGGLAISWRNATALVALSCQISASPKIAVHYSNDTGQTWESISPIADPPGNTYLCEIDAWNETTFHAIWCVTGSTCRVARSTNSGESWTQVNIATSSAGHTGDGMVKALSADFSHGCANVLDGINPRFSGWSYNWSSATGFVQPLIQSGTANCDAHGLTETSLGVTVHATDQTTRFFRSDDRWDNSALTTNIVDPGAGDADGGVNAVRALREDEWVVIYKEGDPTTNPNLNATFSTDNGVTFGASETIRTGTTFEGAKSLSMDAIPGVGFSDDRIFAFYETGTTGSSAVELAVRAGSWTTDEKNVTGSSLSRAVSIEAFNLSTVAAAYRFQDASGGGIDVGISVQGGGTNQACGVTGADTCVTAEDLQVGLLPAFSDLRVGYQTTPLVYIVDVDNFDFNSATLDAQGVLRRFDVSLNQAATVDSCDPIALGGNEAARKSGVNFNLGLTTDDYLLTHCSDKTTRTGSFSNHYMLTRNGGFTISNKDVTWDNAARRLDVATGNCGIYVTEAVITGNQMIGIRGGDLTGLTSSVVYQMQNPGGVSAEKTGTNRIAATGSGGTRVWSCDNGAQVLADANIQGTAVAFFDEILWVASTGSVTRYNITDLAFTSEATNATWGVNPGNSNPGIRESKDGAYLMRWQATIAEVYNSTTLERVKGPFTNGATWKSCDMDLANNYLYCTQETLAVRIPMFNADGDSGAPLDSFGTPGTPGVPNTPPDAEDDPYDDMDTFINTPPAPGGGAGVSPADSFLGVDITTSGDSLGLTSALMRFFIGIMLVGAMAMGGLAVLSTTNRDYGVWGLVIGAFLGLGIGYAFGLIPPWFIILLVVIAAAVIFFTRGRSTGE